MIDQGRISCRRAYRSKFTFRSRQSIPSEVDSTARVSFFRFASDRGKKKSPKGARTFPFLLLLSQDRISRIARDALVGKSRANILPSHTPLALRGNQILSRSLCHRRDKFGEAWTFTEDIRVSTGDSKLANILAALEEFTKCLRIGDLNFTEFLDTFPSSNIKFSKAYYKFNENYCYFSKYTLLIWIFPT